MYQLIDPQFPDVADNEAFQPLYPERDNMTPYNFFALFFSTDVIGYMVEQTNLNIQQSSIANKKKLQEPVTADEIRQSDFSSTLRWCVYLTWIHTGEQQQLSLL